jgi:hypothetical protein
MQNLFLVVNLLSQKLHYWLPAVLSFAFSLLIIDGRGLLFYATYSLASFYILAFSSFFSTKAFLYLISENEIDSVLISNVLIKEVLLRVSGISIAILMAAFFAEGFEDMLVLLLFHSFSQILKVIDPFFEYISVRLKRMLFYTRVQIIFRVVSFFFMALSLVYSSGYFFLCVGLCFAISESFFKCIYIVKLLRVEGQRASVSKDRKESLGIFGVQNFLSVINKQFDTFLLMFVVSDLSIFAPYLFVKQIHGVVMTSTQPITHYFYSKDKINTRVWALVIGGVCISAAAFCELLSLIYTEFNFLSFARWFYIIWLVSLSSSIIPLILVRVKKFKYQLYISLTCSLFVVGYVIFTEVYREVQAEGLIDVRLYVVFLGVLLQFLSVIWIKRLNK